MQLDQSGYNKLVLGVYNRKKVRHELPLSLVQSTPGNIRRECFNVYKERFELHGAEGFGKDEKILRDVFGPGEQGRKFMKTIEDFEVDRFRPLDKFLKGEPKNLSNRDLELLAWLIDFPHRPHAFGQNIMLNDEERAIINGEEGTVLPPNKEIHVAEKKEEVPGTTGEKEPLPQEAGTAPVINQGVHDSYGANISIDKKTGNKWKQLIAFILIPAALIGGGYIWQQNQGLSANENTECMYWAEDHFEPIACNEEQKGRHFFPRNDKVMNEFKMITRKDTITEWSIGKIGYIKDNNIIKYYTTEGQYPEDRNRSVKKLTQRIFDNDSANRRLSAKDSLVAKK